MAKRTTTVFIDDLDGGEAEATVCFSLDGTYYEIDLSAAHARALRDTLARYTAAGRRARNARRTAVTRINSSEIRNWARENGIEVAGRGATPGGRDGEVPGRHRKVGQLTNGKLENWRS
jgi:hypothetical protein